MKLACKTIKNEQQRTNLMLTDRLHISDLKAKTTIGSAAMVKRGVLQ